MKIQLTPSELISQSSEMSSLQGEYEELFERVNSTLKSINESWSNNLANNFTGKINSTQKSFSNMTALLLQGASVASQSAKSMESVDKLIAGIISNENLLGTNTEGQFAPPHADTNEDKTLHERLEDTWDEYKEGTSRIKGVKDIAELIDILRIFDAEDIIKELNEYTSYGFVKTLDYIKDFQNLIDMYNSGDADGFCNLLEQYVKKGIGVITGYSGVTGAAFINIAWNMGENLMDIGDYSQTDDKVIGCLQYLWHVTGGSVFEGGIETGYGIVEKIDSLLNFDINQRYLETTGKTGVEGVYEGLRMIYHDFTEDPMLYLNAAKDAVCDWGKKILSFWL